MQQTRGKRATRASSRLARPSVNGEQSQPQDTVAQQPAVATSHAGAHTPMAVPGKPRNKGALIIMDMSISRLPKITTVAVLVTPMQLPSPQVPDIPQPPPSGTRASSRSNQASRAPITPTAQSNTSLIQPHAVTVRSNQPSTQQMQALASQPRMQSSARKPASTPKPIQERNSGEKEAKKRALELLNEDFQDCWEQMETKDRESVEAQKRDQVRHIAHTNTLRRADESDSHEEIIIGDVSSTSDEADFDDNPFKPEASENEELREVSLHSCLSKFCCKCLTTTLG